MEESKPSAHWFTEILNSLDHLNREVNETDKLGLISTGGKSFKKMSRTLKLLKDRFKYTTVLIKGVMSGKASMKWACNIQRSPFNKCIK